MEDYCLNRYYSSSTGATLQKGSLDYELSELWLITEVNGGYTLMNMQSRTYLTHTGSGSNYSFSYDAGSGSNNAKWNILTYSYNSASYIYFTKNNSSIYINDCQSYNSSVSLTPNTYGDDICWIMTEAKVNLVGFDSYNEENQPLNTSNCLYDSVSSISARPEYVEDEIWVHEKVNYNTQQFSYLLQNSNILVARGHGGYYFGNANETFMEITSPYDDRNIIVYSSYYIDQMSSNSLSNLELVIFAGCHTGAYSDILNTLPEAVMAKGAKSAVGFKEEIQNSGVNEWIEAFFERYETGNTEEAARSACITMYERYLLASSDNDRNKYENLRYYDYILCFPIV